MLPDDKQARNSSGIGMSSSRDGISVSTISSPERYFVSKTRLSRRNAHVADGDDMITVGGVLKHAMTSLPVPNNEYQVVLPTPPKSDQTADDDFCHHIDADLIFSSFPLERLTHSKSALRNLDRPSFVRIETGDALMYNAAQIIRRELVNMIQYDISEFGANDEVQSLTSPISLRQMATSAALLSREITALKSRAGHQLLNGDEYMYTCRNSHTIWNIDTSTSHFTLGHLDGDDNGTAAHTRACSHMARDAQRAGRIEHKIEIVISGLQRRSAELQRRLQRACADLITTDNQYCSYNILLYHEKEVFSKRTEQLKSMIYTASEEERNRQCLHNQYLSQVALMQSSKHPMCE
jgi:pre-mRNA-splicing factor CDC5/CEF1|tara:strand:+ start:100 stop:1152 length:1053 start_codon:yes stop_codon:yes gene_type:complete